MSSASCHFGWAPAWMLGATLCLPESWLTAYAARAPAGIPAGLRGQPDDFTELVDKLQRRLVDKHGRHSFEGRGLRALREIRVRAVPAWDSTDVEIFFWFVREEDDTLFEGTGWSELLSQWLRFVLPAGGSRSKARSSRWTT